MRRILEANGFVFVSQRGSHMKFQPAAGGRPVIVPDNDEIPVGTLGAIIRQSGLPKSAFE